MRCSCLLIDYNFASLPGAFENAFQCKRTNTKLNLIIDFIHTESAVFNITSLHHPSHLQHKHVKFGMCWHTKTKNWERESMKLSYDFQESLFIHLNHIGNNLLQTNITNVIVLRVS